MTKNLSFALVMALMSLCSCGNRAGKKIEKKILLPPSPVYSKGFIPDSSDMYAVVSAPERLKYIFNDKCKPSELTMREIQTVDNLLKMAVERYNKKVNKTRWEPLYNLKNYRRQLVAVTDAN